MHAGTPIREATGILETASRVRCESAPFPAEDALAPRAGSDLGNPRGRPPIFPMGRDEEDAARYRRCGGERQLEKAVVDRAESKGFRSIAHSGVIVLYRSLG